MNMKKYPMVSVNDGMGGAIMTADAVATGMAFLVGELEKRDEKLHEPMTSITWARDMPVRTGGGLVDNVTYFDVSYASSGGSNNGIMGNETNDLPVMQADIGKDSARTFMWGHILKVPMIDQEKLKKIGRSLDDILDKGLHLAHDKTVDSSVYEGFAQHGSYGLVNNPTITTVTAAAGAGGGTDWTSKTPDEILTDVNRVMVDTWSASEYDLTGMANHILVPPAHYAHLVKTKVGVTGDKSILTYLLENNIGKNQGVDLVIAPSRWCEGAGTGNTNRMVAYCNNEDRVRFDMTAPLHRLMTQASAEHLAYLTPYLAQWSEIYWLYKSHAMYMDGI